MARAGPFLFALLLLVPSANYQVFDGLPLSRGAEFVGLALLIPLVLSRALRRLHARWVDSWPRAIRGAALTSVALALGAKLLLLASGTHQGFLACYRTPLQAPTAGPCERSFENQFFRFAVTRIDRAVSFDEHDWNLGFLNAIRFDRHYMGEERGSGGGCRSRPRGKESSNGPSRGSPGSPTRARRPSSSIPRGRRPVGP